MFILDIGLKFSFLVESLLGFGQDDVGLIKWFGKDFLLFGLFQRVSEGVVPVSLGMSGRIWL